MEKKTNKRQIAVVSLSDYNQKQIEDLQQEQKTMMEQFEKRKEGACVTRWVTLSFAKTKV